jgi:hypothetical protein
VPRYAHRRVILFFWPMGCLVREANLYGLDVDRLFAREFRRAAKLF